MLLGWPYFHFQLQQVLLQAESVGERRAEEFNEKRIKHNHAGFYETIKKKLLQQFLSIQKIFVNGKDVFIRTGHTFFAGLLVIKKRDVGIKELLQYSLAQSFVTPDGNNFKSVKSRLQNALAQLIVYHISAPEFLIECVSPNNFQVAWRYLVTYQIL